MKKACAALMSLLLLAALLFSPANLALASASHEYCPCLQAAGVQAPPRCCATRPASENQRVPITPIRSASHSAPELQGLNLSQELWTLPETSNPPDSPWLLAPCASWPAIPLFTRNCALLI